MSAEARKLLHVASEALTELPPNVQVAKDCYEKALSLAPDDIVVLDTVGEFLGDEGHVDLAVQVLARSIELAPEQGFHKYLYLGQMSSGRDALNMFLKGIEILEKESTSSSLTDLEKRVMRMRYCSACVSVVELYMTDLCDEPEARDTCEKHIKLALAADSESFDGLSAQAMFCKVVGEHETAVQAATKAVETLRKLQEASDAEGLVDGGVEEQFVPDPETRTNLARTLVDLEEVELASEVLDGVLQADEENIAAWYMMGCCNLVARKKTPLVNCLRQARELCKKYPDMLEAYQQLLEGLFNEAVKLPEDEEEEDNGEWESDDE